MKRVQITLEYEIDETQSQLVAIERADLVGTPNPDDPEQTRYYQAERWFAARIYETGRIKPPGALIDITKLEVTISEVTE